MVADAGADQRQYVAAAARNAEPILKVLRRYLPERGRVLEIGSGSGQHAVYFARALRGVTWVPSDPDPDARRSIEAWRRAKRADNVAEPLDLDVTAPEWPVDPVDAIVCVNLAHVAPWEATRALFAGAAGLLPTDGVLVLYGPFRVTGEHTAESNAVFDEQLRARDHRWGIRDIDDVAEAARANGLEHTDSVLMPANNRMLVFHSVG